jgi:hypothetical protein
VTGSFLIDQPWPLECGAAFFLFFIIIRVTLPMLLLLLLLISSLNEQNLFELY